MPQIPSLISVQFVPSEFLLTLEDASTILEILRNKNCIREYYERDADDQYQTVRTLEPCTPRQDAMTRVVTPQELADLCDATDARRVAREAREARAKAEWDK